jgi:putative ABC transport system substrate-binding protein
VISRRQVVLAFGAGVLAPLVTHAQQPDKVWRIGMLTPTSFRPEANNPYREPFLRRLLELGYVEGRNVAFEYRSADGKFERFPGLAAELAQLGVDIIVAWTTPATRAARREAPPRRSEIACDGLGPMLPLQG